MKNKHPIPSYFFFFSAVLMLVTKILINSSGSSKISLSSSGFLIHHFYPVKLFFYFTGAMLNVQCSMFISPSDAKNILALMGPSPYVPTCTKSEARTKIAFVFNSGSTSRRTSYVTSWGCAMPMASP